MTATAAPAGVRTHPRRTVTGWAALAVGEALLLEEYVRRAVTWHWLLHSTLGLGLGLAAAAVAAAVRPQARRPGVVGWAVLGQLWSVVPDLLFYPLHLPHRPWMDVFAAHVTIHLVAQPVPTALAVFLLAGWSWWLVARAGRRAAGLVGVLAAVAVLTVALATAAPLPRTLSDLRGHPASAWWCGGHH